MFRPALNILALLAVTTLTHTADATLTNVVTDWINATQVRVAATGVHNVPASRWYAQTALAIHNAVSQGGAPPPALAGETPGSHTQSCPMGQALGQAKN